MLRVIAEIETKEGCREKFLAAFRELVPLVLAEEGCIEYGPTVDAVTEIGKQEPVRENHVIIVERWESLDALNAHLVSDNMTSYRAAVRDLVAGSKLYVLEEV
jgi:quinol monooxygenase YgiN